MRLRTPALLGLPCLAPALLLPLAAPAHAAPALDCAASVTSAAHGFPLTARIHGGPDAYTAGGGHGAWSIDLTNTTDRPCTGVHPVVVLVDERRALRPGQPRLEFYEGARPHPVRFETTEEDELVGAFDDGFPGFTVAPGRTLTVRVRLSITSDAVPNEVTANAAVVQRRDGDGDWVGQSNDYRFRVEAGPAKEPAAPADPPDAAPDASATEGTAAVPEDGPSLADELAGTGLGERRGALAATAALLVAAGGVLLLARRRRR